MPDEASLPELEFADVMALIASDNAEARLRFLDRWPVLTGDEVDALRPEIASLWRAQGCVFSMQLGGVDVYPRFQFKDGLPLEAIGDVIAALPQGLSGWQTAFWLTAANGWLDARRPVDCTDDRDALLAAARRESDDWIG